VVGCVAKAFRPEKLVWTTEQLGTKDAGIGVVTVSVVTRWQVWRRADR
jgi:hypothetical protein